MGKSRILNMMQRSICICLCCMILCGQAFAAGTMTYRDNTVEFEGAAGIDIVSGTFQVSELSITPGQDPESKNYAGQVHTLENGTITFEVGRSASEEVASWFNSRLSGYNDTSVNGDRTTFDHTAGELNFAFIGDLTLTVRTSNDPEGLTVTFEDVALAQGRQFLSNNWWFGQCIGQHTKDSDGANSLLTIGTDTDGNTIYASFLRGDNDVNVITLESITVVEEASDLPYQLSDVEEIFQQLPTAGTLSSLEGFPSSYDATVNHIQGYSPYQSSDGTNYAIATHSVSTADYAHIVAGPVNSGTKWGFKTYLEGWRHPGGIQVIGDYLFVPSEQETTGQVALYDLRSLKVGELRRVETFDLSLDHKAGALGVTAYTDANGVSYYLLVVAHLAGENSVYHVYRAPAADGIETADFSKVGSFSMRKDFQGFGLVTEAGTNQVYMIGLWSPEEGASFADYAYLYQLDTENWTISSEIDSIHMVSSGGGAGMLGVHFRYGAGVLAASEDQLLLSATERNIMLGDVDVNTWSGQQ